MCTDFQWILVAKLAAIALGLSASAAAAPAGGLPTEKDLRSVRLETVLKNLDSGLGAVVVGSAVLDQEIEKLRAEGPEVLPVLTMKLPELKGIGTSVAADLLSEACYEPAVPALLSALESDAFPGIRAKILGVDPKKHLQQALFNVARGIAVPGIVERLFDSQSNISQGFLIGLLARIDTPEASAAIRRFYAKDLSPRRLWWSPPIRAFSSRAQRAENY